MFSLRRFFEYGFIGVVAGSKTEKFKPKQNLKGNLEKINVKATIIVITKNSIKKFI